MLDELTKTEGVDLELHVTRQFDNDEDEWLIGRLTSLNECSSAAGLTQCRTSTRTYDSHGRVRTESASSDDADLETHISVGYARDDFGNIIATIAWHLAVRQSHVGRLPRERWRLHRRAQRGQPALSARTRRGRHVHGHRSGGLPGCRRRRGEDGGARGGGGGWDRAGGGDGHREGSDGTRWNRRCTISSSGVFGCL